MCVSVILSEFDCVLFYCDDATLFNEIKIIAATEAIVCKL